MNLRGKPTSGSAADPSVDRVWSEPLTKNERAIIDGVLLDGGECAKWLRHVLKVYDAALVGVREQLRQAEEREFWRKEKELGARQKPREEGESECLGGSLDAADLVFEP